jgi:hypothetical protein
MQFRIATQKRIATADLGSAHTHPKPTKPRQNVFRHQSGMALFLLVCSGSADGAARKARKNLNKEHWHA